MTIQPQAFEKLAQNTIKELNKRNMEGYYFKDSSTCVKTILSMMPAKSTISFGGSQTLKETGLLQAIKEADYSIIDRSSATTTEESRELYAQTVLSDYYFMSTNAITTNGILVNIDGNANRVACLCHGPSNVMILVGKNKFASSIESAIERIHTYACRPNAIRLNRNTPCALTGVCHECLAPDSFCNQIVITRRSNHPERIKVFLINENLGY